MNKIETEIMFNYFDEKFAEYDSQLLPTFKDLAQQPCFEYGSWDKTTFFSFIRYIASVDRKVEELRKEIFILKTKNE